MNDQANEREKFFRCSFIPFKRKNFTFCLRIKLSFVLKFVFDFIFFIYSNLEMELKAALYACMTQLHLKKYLTARSSTKRAKILSGSRTLTRSKKQK